MRWNEVNASLTSLSEQNNLYTRRLGILKVEDDMKTKTDHFGDNLKVAGRTVHQS